MEVPLFFFLANVRVHQPPEPKANGGWVDVLLAYFIFILALSSFLSSGAAWM